ncbi:LamG domain-containing protein [Nitrosopumilus sp.]|uniref:LamG domain-containing protein n=1 Tax=Nitrosopumilus sp. TaxID=2024843 RepID=UPI00247B4831|nr:LamG domain-containing protein [Nitrosopumilus sp.]MCV0430033.1 LamG domain-containing protein [Nitrosopumilus sp.]
MIKSRGLSSVIGMIFLVIVLSSTAGYFTYSMNLIEKVNDEVVFKMIEIQDKSKEDFEITNARIDAGKFNLTIYNTGEIPINFTRFWINNVTDSTWPLQNFTLNKISTPKETIMNIGQELELQALESQAYSIKIVTQRGLGKEFTINSPNEEVIDLKLMSLPETVSDGFRTTLLLAVTNNMTKSDTLLNIKPTMKTPQTTGTGDFTLISDMDPNQISTLSKGDTAYFTWTYEISGTLGDTITFTASLENGLPQNTASTTVTVNDVLLAQQSQTSLSSNELISPSIKDRLIFHGETTATPNGEYQMFSGDPDSNGLSISVETDNPEFFTNYGGAINIPAGVWNASLTYFSAPFPDSLIDDNSLNMKFHFEENASPEDSTGNTNGHNLGSGSERPTHQTTGGPHGSGAFRFDGGDYIELDNESENDIGSYPDSTSLWFNADDGTNYNQVLYRVNENSNSDYYEIGIDVDDDVYFTFRTSSGGTPTTCESSGFDYENGNWQHLVAVRPGTHQCELYINATSIDVSSIGSGGSQVNTDENFIGAEDSNPNEGFVGSIDDLLHWDNHALSSTEVTDLYNTNYGNSAHVVTFFMNKTNSAGIVQSNIVTNSSYPLKFLDGKENDEFLNSFNYTTSIVSWTNFTNSERLVLDMEFIGGLDMDMRIDDVSLSGYPESSYLQYPSVAESFQSYVTIDADQTSTLSISNGGPNTAWITYEGTRLTFEDISSSNTYAAMILQANSTDVNSVQDSIAFPVGEIIELTFSTPKNPPATTGSTGQIPIGSYNMKMQISGYDIDGKSISRTIEFGTVSVT